MGEVPSVSTVDILIDAVRSIAPRGDIRLSYHRGGHGAQYITYLLRTGEIASISVIPDIDTHLSESSVTLGYSLQHFNCSAQALEDMFLAVGPAVEPRTYEEKLGQWQIARGFVASPINADPNRFEVPSFLHLNPDYIGRFNEVLRTAPSLIGKIREVTEGLRDGIGRFAEGGEDLDGNRGLPELVSTALFVEGQDIYVVRKPQILPGSSRFILADYEWKKKLEIKGMQVTGSGSFKTLHTFGYPLPYSNSPKNERDFTVIYDPENDGFPCIYGESKEAQEAAKQLGLNERFISSVFSAPTLFENVVSPNAGLIFLSVGGRYPLGIHRPIIHPTFIQSRIY